MRWFKRLLWQWASQGQEIEEAQSPIRDRLVTTDENLSVSDDPILNFKIYSAVGGKIVEFRHYDRQKDRNFHQTYIITNDQDFGDRIAKIATMEILKQ